MCGDQPYRPLVSEDHAMDARPLTSREREVLDALLTPELPGLEDFRAQAKDVTVVRLCGCGCPSIDFFAGPTTGMRFLVNAAVTGPETLDGMFLYAVGLPEGGEVLGGIEWVGQGESDPDEFPPALRLVVTATV